MELSPHILWIKSQTFLSFSNVFKFFAWLQNLWRGNFPFLFPQFLLNSKVSTFYSQKYSQLFSPHKSVEILSKLWKMYKNWQVILMKEGAKNENDWIDEKSVKASYLGRKSENIKESTEKGSGGKNKWLEKKIFQRKMWRFVAFRVVFSEHFYHHKITSDAQINSRTNL